MKIQVGETFLSTGGKCTSLFHMVFACIEIPRILLIKGKLHWRAKNRIISAADSPSKLALLEIFEIGIYIQIHKNDFGLLLFVIQ